MTMRTERSTIVMGETTENMGSFFKKYYHLILCEMATIHQFDNNPEEDEFYLVEIYWFITYTLVEPSINQQFIHANTTRLL